MSPGQNSGLRIILNLDKDEYYCSGTRSTGFKGLLHMPSTAPELREYGFGILPGMETFMPMQAKFIHSNEDIIEIDHDLRDCYMQGESKLQYFQHYSYNNCVMECISDHTFHVSTI